MKVLLYSDVHFSQYSSILRKRGEKYSKRLENLVESLNWAENFAKINGCESIICLGDFFDTPSLNCEELTALQDVRWFNSVPHYFLVGNHESNVSNLEYSSTKAIEKPDFHIISTPRIILLENNVDLVFIPYTLEENRKPLSEYIKNEEHINIVLSHNDIKGIRYGKFESKEGFELKDIEDNCDLFLNGHLHNGAFLNDKETILNLGNLTGQNFSEDAYQYTHYVCILDTDTLQMEFYENPFAYNFYSITIKNEKDLAKLDQLKKNAVVSLKVEESLMSDAKEKVSKITDDYRLILYKKDVVVSDEKTAELTLSSIDYLAKFSEFILENVGDFDVCQQEISYIVQGGN